MRPWDCQLVAMAMQKIPVEEIEGAGVFAGSGFVVVAAAFAVVAHFIDVVGG